MPISLPSVTFQIIPASQLAGVTEQKTLIVGQMLAADSSITLDSLTSSSTTATATYAAGHGYVSGMSVTIAGATETEYNGTYEIVVTGATTFTYTFAGSGTSPATGTITATTAYGGTATAGDLIQDHPDDGSEDTLFGAKSHLAGMVRNFKRENKISQLDLIPLDDAGSATQGTAVIAFAGPATAAGTLYATVGSETDHRYELDVSDEDTATEIGDALVALINADGDAPFVSSNTTGTVTLTALNGGTLCNDWPLKIDGTVAGVSFTLTGWANGATDPTLTTVLDVIENVRYQTIVWPAAYTLSTVSDVLDARFNVTNKIMDGVAIQGQKDTAANLQTYVASLNSQSTVVVGQKAISVTNKRIGPATFEFLDTMAAQIAAIRALRLTEDAPLTTYLTTVATRDQYGGIAIGSLPYFNTALPNAGIANPVDDFSQSDLTDLKNNGVGTYGPNRAYNGTIMGEMVTTYLTDTAGNVDLSYKFLNSVDTASLIREFIFENCKTRYAQTRLTDGDLMSGRDLANEGSIRVFLNELYEELADDVLVQKGRAAKKDFNDNLYIIVTVADGSAEINCAPLLVTQLRVVLGTIRINFGSS